MAEIRVQEEQTEPEYPSYSQYGKIVIRVVGPCDNYTWAIDEYAYEGSAFWINEGQGIEYWVYENNEGITGPGYYTMDNIHGTYIKGEWGFTDDDEEWDFDPWRPATPEEIAEL